MKKQHSTPKNTKTPVQTAKPKKVSEKFVPTYFPKWIYLVFVAFCFAIYGNSMLNEYALDDTMVLTQNEFVKQGVSGIPKIFKYDTFIGRYGEQVANLPGGRYRPLSVASLAIEYDIFAGAEVKRIINDKLDPTKQQYTIPRHLLPDETEKKLDPSLTEVTVNKTSPRQNDDDAPLYVKTKLPYVNHFVNILLYAITACFLFMVMWRLFPVKDPKGWKLLLNVPVITTLLYIAHPVHVEAIANIKGRDEIMTFLGALMALYYTLRWLDTRKWKYMAFAFLSFLAGAFAKENAITFLALIPLTVYFFTPYKLKDNFIALLPSLVAALIFLAVRRAVIGAWSPLPETELMNNPFMGMRNVEVWGSIIYVLGRYLWLLIFPHPLTTDYYPYHIPQVRAMGDNPNPAIETIGIGNILVWLPLLLYIAMCVFVLWGMAPKRKNKYAYAVIWYLVPLTVVSNVFVMIGTSMNERFLYISSVGFCLALAYFLVVNLPKWLKDVKLYHGVVVAFLAVVLGLYSAQTIARNPVWHDDFTLSTTDVKTSPNSAKANYDAARVYNIKIQTETDSTMRDFYTRQIYKYSKRAVEIHPNYEMGLLLYAWSNSVLGAYPHPDSSAKYPVVTSIQALKQLLKRNPGNANAYSSLVALSQNLPPVQRVDLWKDVLAIAPDNHEANYQLACVYAKNLNDLPNSLPYFEKAAMLNPNFTNGLVDLGAIYGLLGYSSKAAESFERAVAISPNDTLALLNLWRTYQGVNDAARAQQTYQRYMTAKSMYGR